MGLSFPKYLEWLEKRKLNWPQPPPIRRLKTKPINDPLPGIRAICWEPYGTLLRISHGELLNVTPEPISMQIALDKTIQEFNMWNSMVRKKGHPWEVMLPQYESYREEKAMVAVKVGEIPEIDSTAIWKRIIQKLQDKDFQYDERFHGDLDDFSRNVAYFFHACLQGVEASPRAADALSALHAQGYRQGVLGNGQKFTFGQMLRHLNRQSKLSSRKTEVLEPSLVTLSSDVGVKAPSPTLFQLACRKFLDAGFRPFEVLYIGCKLKEGLTPAREVGFRTALYAGDANSLRATMEDYQKKEYQPDRIITEFTQLPRIVGKLR